LWVWDLNLDILSNLGNNTEKTWIVLFKASEFASLWHDFQEYALPKSWVVVVIWKSQENKWHIETLCAEKGLLLIFNDNYKSWPISALFSWNNDFVHIDEFHWEKKLHIVMDWLVWKIYKQ
jgi:hypothetical protein